MALEQRSYPSDLECQFYKSCMAVKKMGIEVREIRKLLVSNLMCCIEKKIKSDSNKRRTPKAIKTRDMGCQYGTVKAHKTRDVGCQHKTIKAFKGRDVGCQYNVAKGIKTRDVGCQYRTEKALSTKDVACQHKPIKGRDVGCQYNANKKRKTKDVSCQHLEIKLVDGSVDVGTNTSFLSTASVEGVPLSLSPETLLDDSKFGIVKHKRTRPSPHKRLSHKRLSQTSSTHGVLSPVPEEAVPVHSNYQGSPEIPRQDSAVYATSSRSSLNVSKRRSLVLEQSKLDDNTVFSNVPSSSSDGRQIHVDLHKSSRLVRKRKSHASEPGDCARVRPNIKRKRKLSYLKNVEVSNEIEQSSVADSIQTKNITTFQSMKKNKKQSRRNQTVELSLRDEELTEQFTDADVTKSTATTKGSREDRVLSSFSPKDQQEIKNTTMDQNSIMPSPDNHMCLVEPPSQSRLQEQLVTSESLLISSSCQASPEIPRQDSVEFNKTSTSRASRRFVKRKSLRLVLKRLDRSKMPAPVTSVDTVPGSREMGLQVSGFLTKSAKTKHSKKKQSQTSTSGVKKPSMANTTVKLDTTPQFIPSPQKKRKTILGNRKLEAFRLSVVDDKEYTERNSTIRMDTSVLVAPRLRQASFF